MAKKPAFVIEKDPDKFSNSRLLYEHFKVQAESMGVPDHRTRQFIGMAAKYCLEKCHWDHTQQFPLLKRFGKTYEDKPPVQHILQGFAEARTTHLSPGGLYLDAIAPMLELTGGLHFSRKPKVVRKRMARLSKEVGKALRKLRKEEHLGPGTRAITYTVNSIRNHFLRAH